MKQRPMTRLAVAAVAACLGLTISACGSSGGSAASSGSSGSSGGLQTITYELEWVPNPDFTGLYYAIKHGFFAKQGLKLNLAVNTDGGVPSLIATNRADLGNGSVQGQIAAKLQGLPVASVATFMAGVTSALIISGKAGVKTIADLKGKTIGYYNNQSLTNLDYLLSTNGVSPSSVKTINVGDSLIQPMVSGKVDAIMGGLTNVEAIQIGQEMGVDPVVFPLPQLGYPSFPEFTIMANTNRLASDPKYRSMVTKFITAYVEGIKAAKENIADAVSIMEQETNYTPKFLQKSVPITLDALTPPTGDTWACFNNKQITTITNFYAQKHLTTGDPATPAIFTNKYVPWSCPA